VSVPPRLNLERAARDLGLTIVPPGQDWGIIHADAGRLPEFVDYYGSHAPEFQDNALEYCLGELLLESANDAILEVIHETVISQALRLIVSRQHYEPTRLLLEYWSELGLSDEEDVRGAETTFPVGNALRQLLLVDDG